jgi:predicted PurR-regulated permease PerM
MEFVYFLLVGAGLYWLSDHVLDRLERHWQRRFEHRSLVFLAILGGLALAAFALIRWAFEP